MTEQEAYRLYMKPDFSMCDLVEDYQRQINTPTMEQFGTAMANKGKRKKKR